jgi:hypothetical protein
MFEFSAHNENLVPGSIKAKEIIKRDKVYALLSITAGIVLNLGLSNVIPNFDYRSNFTKYGIRTCVLLLPFFFASIFLEPAHRAFRNEIEPIRLKLIKLGGDGDLLSYMSSLHLK